MSTSNTYRPRRRVQRSQSRKPSCSYCKEDGHWMKHRSGEAICPKLKAKTTRQRETNHSLAEHRRQAIAAGEWVASQGRSAPRQPRKRTNARPAVNRFEIPSDTESDGTRSYHPAQEGDNWSLGFRSLQGSQERRYNQALASSCSKEIRWTACRNSSSARGAQVWAPVVQGELWWILGRRGWHCRIGRPNRRPRRSTHNIPSVNKTHLGPRDKSLMI